MSTPEAHAEQLRRATHTVKDGTGWPEPHGGYPHLDCTCVQTIQGCKVHDVTASRRVRTAQADAYLAGRTSTYAHRCQRYDAALEAIHRHGLDDGSTVVDVGSGWGELGVRLHTGTVSVDHPPVLPPSRARYIPVDACIDGVDLETWTPPRTADWFVCLEVLEHLRAPARLLHEMQARATRGVIVSTPNPDVCDVLAMCPTHVQPLTRAFLEMAGMTVEIRSFYGRPDDSLFAWWLA